MQLSLSPSNLLLWGLLTGLCSAAPAPQVELPVLTLPGGIPPTCIKFQDGVIKTPTCYTRTATTTRKNCPLIKCVAPTDPIMCPMYIKVTTTSVPCSTDCCPTTPTKYVTKPCPSCTTGCVIPTETITVTTGCKTAPPGGGIITATATLIVG